MLKPVNLKVEYKKNPLGMDEVQPRFFYALEGSGKRQISRRIQVYAADSGMLMWDSGEICDSSTIQIVYCGKHFKPFTRYCWKVLVKDDCDEMAESTEEAFFETGFMETEWTAKWITSTCGGDVCMRKVQQIYKDFEIRNKPLKARLYATALGLYEAYINGKKVTENCLTPGWTDYYTRVQYQAYDVTGLLSEGVNTLSSILGEGWYCGTIARTWAGGNPTYGSYPMLRMELQLEYENGEKQIIASNGAFCSHSFAPAVRMSDIYMGETYEAFRDEEDWKKSQVVRNGPGVSETDANVQIVWQSGPDIRRVCEIHPLSINRKENGTWLVDFGQNLAGRERIHLRNTLPNTCITIRHGEMLRDDGTLYVENLRDAAAETKYICGKHEETVYEPVFTYYGFRYLEITGWPGDLKPDQIAAEVLSSDLERTGSFSCSNPLLNKLYSNIIWGQRSNFIDVPTDCPQRDERFGWTGDTQVFANVATYNFSSPEFYTKWLVDLNRLQSVRGGYPNVCPDPFVNRDWKHVADFWQMGNTGWADAGIVCPWILLLKYGDSRICSRYFDQMMRWIHFQINKAHGSLIVKNAVYGDWLNVNAPVPEELLSTAYLAGMCGILAKMGDLIGRENESAYLRQLREQIAEAYADTFFKDCHLIVRTQTSALLTLIFDLAPNEDARRNTCEFLKEDIKENRHLHLSTGFLGTPLLLKTLSSIGETDLAYALLQQTSYPGWLYPVTQGATTMWERWNSWSEQEGFGGVGMNSFNHYAYGAVGDWFYETICGIQPLNEKPEDTGFRRWKLSPDFGHSLTSAEASYQSICGQITSAWKRVAEKEILWTFTVPVNTSAKIILPSGYRIVSASGACTFADEREGVAEPGVCEIHLKED